MAGKNGVLEWWPNGSGYPLPQYSITSMALPIPLNLVHAAARGRLRLVFSRQPIRILARAVAFDLKLRSPHVGEFNLDGITGIHRLQSFVKSAGGDDVSRIEFDETR